MIFRITFDVSTPIITSTQIHLDALFSAVHPAMHNLDVVTRQSASKKITMAPLQIDSAVLGNTWVWCCTVANYSEDAQPYHDKITKRKDGADYFYLNTRQTPRSGVGRDHCDTIYGVVCSSVSFIVSTDKKREMERLANRVKGIGSLRKMGYGAVTRYSVDPEPNFCWRDCIVQNGIAMRNIPAELIVNPSCGRVYTKPPYWAASNLNQGVEAGDFAELRQEVQLKSAYRRD